ncbi:MAG: hypothetical protein R2710_01170 [Acidimicrobiales bacterium]
MGRRERSFVDLEGVLLELVDRVSRRLRNGHRVGRTVTLRFRFGDFTRDTRSHTLHEATASTAAFLDVARILLVARRAEIEQRTLTLLGFTISNLAPANAVQQTLPFDSRSSAELDAALDTVKDRFGSKAIGRAALVGQRPAFTVPLLPDPMDG